MTHNGYKNYETWNVALWIDNDQETYKTAKILVNQGVTSYKELVKKAGFGYTGDGVSFTDKKLDIAELWEELKELKEVSDNEYYCFSCASIVEIATKKCPECGTVDF